MDPVVAAVDGDERRAEIAQCRLAGTVATRFGDHHAQGSAVLQPAESNTGALTPTAPTARSPTLVAVPVPAMPVVADATVLTPLR